MASPAYKVVDDFEKAIADFTRAPYAVSVESCSAALFLCCKWVDVANWLEVEIPRLTYVSVPAQIIHAGGRVSFRDEEWQEKGFYDLGVTQIVDSAKRLTRKMWEEFDFRGKLVCLSFHGKKPLKIGRGGMILTDDHEAVKWLKCARFDGRHEVPMMEDTFEMAGFNMYLQPEQAARGLERLQWLGDGCVAPYDEYQDLSKYEFFTGANRT